MLRLEPIRGLLECDSRRLACGVGIVMVAIRFARGLLGLAERLLRVLEPVLCLANCLVLAPLVCLLRTTTGSGRLGDRSICRAGCETRKNTHDSNDDCGATHGSKCIVGRGGQEMIERRRET